MSPDAVKGRRVLVTGGSGFIGSHVVAALLDRGAELTVLTSAPSGETPPRLRAYQGDIEVIHASLLDVAAIRAAVATRPVTHVLHLAGFTHVGRSFRRMDSTISLNVQGTVNLLEALGGNMERFVYVGSGDVYGDAPVPLREDGPVRPMSPYAVSKYAAERFCRMFHQAYGWPIVCLRPFNVYGPGQSVDRIIPELITACLGNQRLKMTAGAQTREFSYVVDVADALVRALVVPSVLGEVINVGSGQEVSIRDLALTVLTSFPDAKEPAFGALDYRPTEVWRMFADVDRARRLLGWAAHTKLTVGLDQTIDWYRRSSAL